ncbi:hypothetical protein [Streptomyces sp. NPDC021020]|uniref:hypothetical protein n=1 Tax=Streptomyces sp. NPDC021020 TaxID=3365109 RepID=UPI0037A56B59
MRASGTPLTRGAAALAACCVLLAVTACGGHSGPPAAPEAGQARVVARTPADGGIGPEDSGATRGVAVGADGTVYVDTGERLVRLGEDGVYTDVSGRQSGRPARQDRGMSGLVLRGDGSMLAGEDGQVVAIDPDDGQVTELAGTAGTFRSLTDPVPRSAAAAGFRFTREVTPLAVEKDGTVVIADGTAVWALSGGRLTQRYRQAAVKPAADYMSPFVGQMSAAGPDGTAFLVPGNDTASLADIVVVPGDGRAPHKLAVPARPAGTDVPTADLAATYLASDGAGGVYANTFRRKGRGLYVVHVHDGRIDVAASSTATATSDTCDVHKLVAARGFPCYFPEGIAYRAGHVYLAGQRSYVLDIGVAAG